MDKYSLLRCELLPGELVSLIITDEIFEIAMFNTLCKRGVDYALFESIRLASWPGWNDFFGTEISIKHGDTATIIKKIGRPHMISDGINWAIYDVYEILINGKKCQAFRCNLKPQASSSGGVK
jgi:hypothetical protein